MSKSIPMIAFAVILAGISIMDSSLGLPAATKERAKSGGAVVVSWKAPTGEKLYKNYTLRVNRQAVPVYSCRVSAMPFNQV